VKRSLPWLLVLGVASLFSTACVGKHVPLHAYTRSEQFSLEHARWLNRHCDLIQVASPADAGNISNDVGNFALELGDDQGKPFFDGSRAQTRPSLVYVCDQPTPWERKDTAKVRYYHEQGLKSGDWSLKCPAALPSSAHATFEVISPGSGPEPSAESYVRYRISPRVVIPHGREKEAEEWGVVAGPKRAWETANHLHCSLFYDALSRLKVGGKAHVSALNRDALGLKPNDPMEPLFHTLPPGMLEWDIELLEIGTVDLLYKQVGYSPWPSQ
jgi:hypothetical protein